ncbi:helix-hairpin-helix domain-containing protein [Streptomyces sp. DSM 44917]|uniref:Helix-hairpin-helix domain-containing protein n=1 Tax=Streptomyces boetiae TaxID=3075541 RepID=A0ABU2L302_9ACTN|nr:helix-hairpin-helix domain-containing protein [Streptomyces sp. DSM 44917]MDT0305939.1 helix-hairpin-helix domain-containing protein [Streptomyces sp. DSM 44917]
MRGPSGAAGSAADRAAELRAAVRAVESGERSADSFFTRPAPPRRAAPRAPAPAVRPTAPDRPVPVPAGLPELLAEGGAPPGLAQRVAAALGAGAAEELRADPWRLLAAPGVGPEQADGFARALLGPAGGPGDPRRTRALTGWLLERAARAGHTALEASVVARELAGCAVPDPDEAVREAVEAGAVLVFRDAAPGADAEAEPRVLLGLERYALAEESLADGLARLRGTFAGAGPDWSTPGAGPAGAAELIRAAAGGPLAVHSGGEAARAEPAALVAAARAAGLRACAAARTHDGRARLAALLPREDAQAAVTLAGLLEGSEGPGRDAEGLLALDLVAVLDAGQLGAEEAAALVESLPDGSRLVLSGDPLVLGPAGPGQVLADVLAAGICPRLASRVPDPGPVGELVSGIGAGELTEVAAPDREVVIVPVGDPGEAVHRAVQLVADSIPRAFGRPAGEARVITAAHGGPAGTRALNAALKERLSPGPGRFGGFDPGDPVAHSPAPGRTRLAVVADADAEGLWLRDGAERFRVARELVAETVRHGWALTAHQAAGCRWSAAVVVVPGDPAGVAALDRSWVYTAFGRAEHHLSVVQGAGPGLATAVARPPAARTTRLRALLGEQAAAGAG